MAAHKNWKIDAWNCTDTKNDAFFPMRIWNLQVILWFRWTKFMNSRHFQHKPQIANAIKDNVDTEYTRNE